MAQTAEILGKDPDAKKFRAMHEERKKFFNSKFVDGNKKTLAVIGARRDSATATWPMRYCRMTDFHPGCIPSTKVRRPTGCALTVPPAEEGFGGNNGMNSFTT